MGISTPNWRRLVWMLYGSVEGAVQVLDGDAPIPQEFAMEIRVSIRRVVVSLSSAFPLQKLFAQVAACQRAVKTGQ